MGPGGRPGPGEEGGTCSGLKPGEGAGRVRGCPGSEPGLHHYSGDWGEGGAAELRGAASALRLRSSQGTGLQTPQASGIRWGRARSGEPGQRYCGSGRPSGTVGVGRLALLLPSGVRTSGGEGCKSQDTRGPAWEQCLVDFMLPRGV